MMNVFKKINRKIINNILLAYSTTLVLTINKTTTIHDYKSFLYTFKADTLIAGTLFFAVLYFISKNEATLSIKREKKIISIFSAILSLIFVVGSDITYTQSIFRGSINKYSLLIFTLLLVCYYFILKYFLALLWSKYSSLDLVETKKDHQKFNWKKYLYFLAPFLAVRLIAFIVFFPGITTWDSMYIIGEGLGYSQLSNSHPYIYTYIAGLFAKFGWKVFSGVGIGVAIFNFLTLVITSIIFTLVLYKIFQFCNYKWINGGLYIFYLLYPNFVLYSFTLYKDIHLMNALLIFFLCLVYIMYSPESFFTNKYSLALFVISFFGVYMLHRKAVIYVVIGILFIFIFNKKYYKPFLKYTALATLFTLLINSTMMHLLRPEPSAKKYDYLSSRFQQLAAAVYYHPESFSKEDLEFYDSTLGLADNKNFSYYTADNIKTSLTNEKLEHRTDKFLKIWAKGYKAHPKLYIEAILNLSVSYWYPYNYPEFVYIENYYDYMYQQNKNFYGNTITHDAKIINSFTTEKITKLRVFLLRISDFPVLSILYKSGIYTIFLLIIFMLSILKRDRKILPLIFLSISIILTCIYSPVVNYFRYSYIFMVLIPLLLPLVLSKSKK